VIRSSAYYLQRRLEKEDEKVVSTEKDESQVEVCDSIVAIYWNTPEGGISS